jgi:hypothetical protein
VRDTIANEEGNRILVRGLATAVPLNDNSTRRLCGDKRNQFEPRSNMAGIVQKVVITTKEGDRILLRRLVVQVHGNGSVTPAASLVEMGMVRRMTRGDWKWMIFR